MPEDWSTVLKEQFLNVNGKVLLARAVGGEDNLKIKEILLNNNLKMEDFEAWDGHDFVFDFYRLHNGNHLALKDIGFKRIQEYQVFLNQLSKMENPKTKNLARDFAQIFQKHFEGAPSDHFIINLEKGEVKAIRNK